MPDPTKRVRERAALKPSALPASEVREGSTRVITEWSLSLIRSAEAAANSGKIAPAAMLCGSIMADDRVCGALGSKSGGIVGLPLTFEKAGDRRRSARAVKALEIEADWWELFPEPALRKMLDWGEMLGICPVQLVWRIDEETGRAVFTPRVWHPAGLEWDADRSVWTIQAIRGGELAPVRVDIVHGDGQWMLYRPYGEERPWEHGAWRSIARWFLLKQYARDDMARFGEGYTPTWVATSPAPSQGVPMPSLTKDQRRLLADDLDALARKTAIVMPPGYSLDSVLATASSVDVFTRQIDMADAATAIRLLGQNLTTDVKGGSFAAATVHQNVRLDLIRMSAETLATACRQQALVHWARFNFGDPALAPWPAWDTTPPENRQARAQMLLTAGQGFAALQKAGVSVDVVAECERLDIALLPDAPSQSPGPVPGPSAKHARGRMSVRAPASGSPADLVASLAAGSDWCERVASDGAAKFPSALESIRGAVERAVSDATSLPDVRVRLRTLFLDPGQFSDAASRDLADRAARVTGYAGAYTAQREIDAAVAADEDQHAPGKEPKKPKKSAGPIARAAADGDIGAPVDLDKAVDAVAWFTAKLPVLRDAADRLDAWAKRRAFWVSGVTSIDVAHDVWAAVDRAIADGGTLAEFRSETLPRLLAEWNGEIPGRIETIFRTNVQSAYAAARHGQMKASASLLPYWQFQAILDARTSSICEPRDGVLLPVGDAWWAANTPPLHHQCRSGVIALTKRQGEAVGQTARKDLPDVQPDDGFGLSPGEGEFSMDRSKYPPELLDAWDYWNARREAA